MGIYNINKNGNLEIEQDLIRYRVPLIEYDTDDHSVIEKDMKRKAKTINHNPNYLTPFRVEIINNSVVYYYDVKNLVGFLNIRDFRFEEKLKYFSSLVEIAKNNETKVTWNKHNFVVDSYEENIKAIIYETDLVKLHEQTKVLEGIKELILISLTNLDSIVGKPRKVNFIDKDEDIINFAETILLKIENLDDLENFIKTKAIEYEHGKPSPKNEETEETTEKSKKTFMKLNPKNKPKKSKTKPKRNAKKNKLNTKQFIMYGGLGLLLLVGILLNTLPTESKGGTTENANADSEINSPVSSDPVDKSTDTSNEELNNKDMEEIETTDYDKKLLLAYRYSLTDNKTQAINVLEKIGYNKLPKQDQEIMLNIYEQLRMYEKAIDLEPSRAEKVVNTLIADNNNEKIYEIQKKIKKENPYINFEVAYLQGESEKVLKLKDSVELNGRKEKQIMESYLKLGMIGEAEDFADKIGNPDLMQMVQTYK